MLNLRSLPFLSLFLMSVLMLAACQIAESNSAPPLPTVVSNVDPSTAPPQPTTVALTPLSSLTPSPGLTEASTQDIEETKAVEPPPETPEKEPSDTPTVPPATETPTSQPTAAPTPLPTETPISTAPLEAISINLSLVASGFTKPIYLTHAGDGSGRLFVVEQAGRVFVLKNGEVLPTPFLDIVSIVGSDANEQGLLSMAFHPDYANNGLFFVYYTNKQGDVVIARYQVADNPDVADPNRATILLTVAEPFGNHNGGQLVFGPDGFLYVGLGDGGAANDPQNNGQQVNTLLGKILRLDIDQGDPYGVPENNPFVARDDSRPEIWSYGWRNPWRFSFDRAKGDMYVADVGQNQFEEVNVELSSAAGGQNYGWRLMEGLHCFDPSECDPISLGLVLPITEYDHSQGCSITGGYVYRGGQFPDLTGLYLYGDFCSGTIWGLRQEPDGSWSEAELLRTDHNISSFGEDEGGEVYLVDHQGNVLQVVN